MSLLGFFLVTLDVLSNTPVICNEIHLFCVLEIEQDVGRLWHIGAWGEAPKGA